MSRAAGWAALFAHFARVEREDDRTSPDERMGDGADPGAGRLLAMGFSGSEALRQNLQHRRIERGLTRRPDPARPTPSETRLGQVPDGADERDRQCEAIVAAILDLLPGDAS